MPEKRDCKLSCADAPLIRDDKVSVAAMTAAVATIAALSTPRTKPGKRALIIGGATTAALLASYYAAKHVARVRCEKVCEFVNDPLPQGAKIPDWLTRVLDAMRVDKLLEECPEHAEGTKYNPSNAWKQLECDLAEWVAKRQS